MHVNGHACIEFFYECLKKKVHSCRSQHAQLHFLIEQIVPYPRKKNVVRAVTLFSFSTTQKMPDPSAVVSAFGIARAINAHGMRISSRKYYHNTIVPYRSYSYDLTFFITPSKHDGDKTNQGAALNADLRKAMATTKIVHSHYGNPYRVKLSPKLRWSSSKQMYELSVKGLAKRVSKTSSSQ